MDKLKRSSKRQLFNHFYTAITRATNSLSICESNINKDVLDLFFKDYFLLFLNNVEIEDIGFKIINSKDEWEKIARDKEKDCSFDNYKLMQIIKDAYDKAGNIKKYMEYDIILRYCGENDELCISDFFRSKLYSAAYRMCDRLNLYLDAATMLLYDSDFVILEKYMKKHNISYEQIFNSKFGKNYLIQILEDVNEFNNNLKFIMEDILNGKK